MSPTPLTLFLLNFGLLAPKLTFSIDYVAVGVAPADAEVPRAAQA